jgi:hypothetical protein
MFPSRNSGYIVRKFARKYCSEEWWWRRNRLFYGDSL